MFDEQAKAIETRLNDHWQATPIVFDDVDYVPSRGKPWIRCQISWSGSDQIAGTADAGVYRERGIVTIGVFTTRNQGSRTNQNLASDVAKIFRGWTDGTLFCEAPYIVRVGEEKEWYHSNLIIPFYYNNCFTQEVQ